MNSRQTKTASTGERPVTIRRRISESTIHRLSLYYRLLAALEGEGYHTVSSKDLAHREKLTPAQVRKDLSFFGSFGTRGLGYPTTELKARIASVPGVGRPGEVGAGGGGGIGGGP